MYRVSSAFSTRWTDECLTQSLPLVLVCRSAAAAVSRTLQKTPSSSSLALSLGPSALRSLPSIQNRAAEGETRGIYSISENAGHAEISKEL